MNALPAEESQGIKKGQLTSVPMLQAGTQDRKVGASKAQETKGGLIDTQPVRGAVLRSLLMHTLASSSDVPFLPTEVNISESAYKEPE